MGQIDEFVEKPDVITAQAYLDHGGYFWNGGMFVFKASTMLEAFAEHAPDVLAACNMAVSGAQPDGSFLNLEIRCFESAP